MIAGLPMYDRPELRAETDALWTAVRDALGSGPAHLSRDLDLWDLWLHPGLLLAQTCGLPLRTGLAGRVSYVGSPDYALPGCPPGYYNSVLVARRNDPRPLAELAARPVINQSHSQSGNLALMDHLAARGITPGTPLESGAHVASARMIAEGRADLAAIDAQTWRLILRHDAFAADLREIERTRPTPATPFISRAGADVDALRAALRRAIVAIGPHKRNTLGLQGLVILPATAYPRLEAPATASA